MMSSLILLIEAIRRAHRVVNKKVVKRKDEIFNVNIEIEIGVP